MRTAVPTYRNLTKHANGKPDNGRDADLSASVSVRNLTDLSGRVAVVVGGTSGLGRAIALGLAEAGASVVPVGRRMDRVEAVCAEVEQRGRSTWRQAVDVTRRASLDE